MNEYELFHDESQEEGFWHGILLVPVEKKKHLTELLEKIRKNTGHTNAISFKEIKKQGRVYDCSRAWLSLANVALAQKNIIPDKLSYYAGKPGGRQSEYEILQETIKAKFILFRERDSHKKMGDYYSNFTSKVETTLRMAIKSGLHYLGKEKSTIKITKMYFDGWEHNKRRLDKKRIVDKLLPELRPYCDISDDPNIIDDRQSNHNKPDSHEYENCQLIQLTDLLVSGFRFAFSANNTHQYKKNAVRPLIDMANKKSSNPARWKNSRWFNSILISECFIENNQWNFTEIEIKSAPKIDTQFKIF